MKEEKNLMYSAKDPKIFDLSIRSTEYSAKELNTE